MADDRLHSDYIPSAPTRRLRGAMEKAPMFCTLSNGKAGLRVFGAWIVVKSDLAPRRQWGLAA